MDRCPNRRTMREIRISARIRELEELRRLILDRIRATLETGGESSGDVLSYTIGDRSVTRASFDVSKLWADLRDIDDELDGLWARLCDGRARKQVHIVPRDF